MHKTEHSVAHFQELYYHQTQQFWDHSMYLKCEQLKYLILWTQNKTLCKWIKTIQFTDFESSYAPTTNLDCCRVSLCLASWKRFIVTIYNISNTFQSAFFTICMEIQWADHFYNFFESGCLPYVHLIISPLGNLFY